MRRPRPLAPRLLALIVLVAGAGGAGGSGGSVAADEPPAPTPAPAPPAPAPLRGGQPPAPPALPTWTYLDSAAVAARLEALTKRTGPGLPPVTLSEYGRSAGDKPLLALWVGRPGRPLVLVHGGLAADDAAGTVACLDLAERLLTDEGRAALESVAYLLLPAPNPDALDAFLAGRPRAGGGALDRDQDGARGEDGPDDLDGDGEVLQMRRPSATGVWAAASGVEPPGTPQADPRRMVEKGPDARRPVSYDLGEEGRDDDGDGEVNEDAPGMDLSRQMAGWWDHQGPWKGEGGFPGQAPETRALMELSFETPNLLAWYGFRSEGPYLLRASEHGALADADAGLYDQVGGALKARVHLDLRKASDALGGRFQPGSDLDWAAAHLGLVAFAVPVWRIPKQDGYAAERAVADEVDWLLWNDRALDGQGFVAWKPFAHPSLGEVEIGGWKRFTRRQPPPRLLADAVHAVSAAPLVHAGFAPRLALTLAVKDLGAGLFEVRARAQNAGGGPSDTVLAGQRRRDMPVRLALAPEDGVERVGGPAKADLGTLAAGASSSEVVWLLRRAPPRAQRDPKPLLGVLTAEHRVAGRTTVEVKAP